MQRLDKVLSSMGEATRKDVRKLVRDGRITVDGEIAVSWDQKVDETASVIAIDGEVIEMPRIIVAMMNKPQGYVTSTEDPRDPTVMSLLPRSFLKQKVYPVGRLDKDTEGLLIFTNDGALAHRLIAPKHGIEKEYYVEHIGTSTDEIIADFASGLVLSDGTECRPAILKRIEEGKSLIVITEGKYHQVRRMMASKGLEVTYLRRIREGRVVLGSFPLGEVRELSSDEIDMLSQHI